MREINRLRRGKDKTTDVLSFPLEFDLSPLQKILPKMPVPVGKSLRQLR